MIGFTETLALELTPYNIIINAICPGFIETEMLKDFIKEQARFLGQKEEDIKKSYLQLSRWNKFGFPQDVANMAVFLASSETDYITDQAINVCAAGKFH